MYCRVRPRHLVDYLVSCSEDGSLEAEGRVFDVSVPGCWCPSRKDLVPAQYVQARLRLPIPEKAIAVRLAAVIWTHEARFGLEILMMDAEDKARLMRYLEARRYLPRYIRVRLQKLVVATGTDEFTPPPALTPSIGMDPRNWGPRPFLIDPHFSRRLIRFPPGTLPGTPRSRSERTHGAGGVMDFTFRHHAV
ncbi:MAG TPA: PilZ domain-containing protein [Nitrospiraceae bacterium]|jgi:hypothetical protein|nr:PilZ domain-containing protein [Nitrospiraceae bacterium]